MLYLCRRRIFPVLCCVMSVWVCVCVLSYSFFFIFNESFFEQQQERWRQQQCQRYQPNGICISLDEIPVATRYWIFLSNNENKTNLKTFTSLKLLCVRQSLKLIQFSIVHVAVAIIYTEKKNLFKKNWREKCAWMCAFFPPTTMRLSICPSYSSPEYFEMTNIVCTGKISRTRQQNIILFNSCDNYIYTKRRA